MEIYIYAEINGQRFIFNEKEVETNKDQTEPAQEWLIDMMLRGATRARMVMREGEKILRDFSRNIDEIVRAVLIGTIKPRLKHNDCFCEECLAVATKVTDALREIIIKLKKQHNNTTFEFDGLG